ncbi:starvation-inducible DNA-binding protein [Endobacter medicaginis]|jgi:starvation-inducible DNA-binding protein|uniref:DNA starvation/stationary phase protection protein Dps n=1 Tax=Endobacter medicaginis TaxID=1181271 RepID=A0A850NNQ5_9PROT|nr:DNA starvation/stationary phase protection protein Dps [Endobacter medicaginis]MBB3175095.1 starvation-inducible DNA-binding protein [Endobacter medicaginis]MCX5476410.1 DNA starvation/stationary phase protection protein Dps [Endobacter medicaginis]NVN31203.1 DNA starvation/stationary phase protection protein Dps [Endobacter medicaginis]
MADASTKHRLQPRMHRTRNNLDDNARGTSIDILNKRLADGLDLALAVKQAHWNLKGPQFIGIHLMLDGFRTELDDLNDKMAERITAIGGTAFGTTQAIDKTTSLTPYPTDIYAIADHLAALIDRYATVANSVREGIDETDDAGDADTSDLLTEASRALDKQLWFLEAHVQEPTGQIRDGDGKGQR